MSGRAPAAALPVATAWPAAIAAVLVGLAALIALFWEPSAKAVQIWGSSSAYNHLFLIVPIWNDFFFPLVFLQTDARKTLPQGLTTFMGEFNTDWGALFAGLTLSALPIIIVYIVLSRQFIAGMTSGALK